MKLNIGDHKHMKFNQKRKLECKKTFKWKEEGKSRERKSQQKKLKRKSHYFRSRFNVSFINGNVILTDDSKISKKKKKSKKNEEKKKKTNKLI